MKLNVVIFCLIFSNFSIITKSDEDECPAEKRVVRSTVEEYVEEKIKEGIAKVCLETVIVQFDNLEVISSLSDFASNHGRNARRHQSRSLSGNKYQH